VLSVRSRPTADEDARLQGRRLTTHRKQFAARQYKIKLTRDDLVVDGDGNGLAERRFGLTTPRLLPPVTTTRQGDRRVAGENQKGLAGHPADDDCGSLPKPAWLATPKQLWAPWLLEANALDEASAIPCVLAIATRGCGDRHRHRRRADAPPFVTTFIENPMVLISSTRRRCASAIVTMPSADGRGRSRAVIGVRDDAKYLRAQTKNV